MPPERLGLFGGTFDPPHVGHLILASEACSQLHLSRLLWVITPTPPHKLGNDITPLEHRIGMLECAISDNPSFQLSRVELERPGPHYTLDTVNVIRERHPSAEVVLIIGGDSLRDLPSWHRPAELVSACSEIGVMRRPGDFEDLRPLEASLPGIASKLRFVDAPLLEIASSDIRRRLIDGEPFRYYLPASVYAYILEHHLYSPPQS